MAKFVPTQSSYCSMQDENKICSFDIEVLTGPARICPPSFSATASGYPQRS